MCSGTQNEEWHLTTCEKAWYKFNVEVQCRPISSPLPPKGMDFHRQGGQLFTGALGCRAIFPNSSDLGPALTSSAGASRQSSSNQFRATFHHNDPALDGPQGLIAGLSRSQGIYQRTA